MSCGCQSPHFHLSLSQCLPSIPCFLNLSSFFFFSSAHPSICLYQSSWGNALLQRATEGFVTLLYNHPPCSDAASPFVDIQKKKTVLFKALCSRLFFPVLPWVNCITFHTHVKSLPMKTWRIYYIYKAPAAFDNKMSTSWILNFLQSFIFEKKTKKKHH